MAMHASPVFGLLEICTPRTLRPLDGKSPCRKLSFNAANQLWSDRSCLLLTDETADK